MPRPTIFSRNGEPQTSEGVEGVDYVIDDEGMVQRLTDVGSPLPIKLWYRTWDINGVTYKWIPTALATGGDPNVWKIINPGLLAQMRASAIPAPDLWGKYIIPASLGPWSNAARYVSDDPFYKTPAGMFAIASIAMLGAGALVAAAPAGAGVTAGAVEGGAFATEGALATTSAWEAATAEMVAIEAAVAEPLTSWTVASAELAAAEGAASAVATTIPSVAPASIPGGFSLPSVSQIAKQALPLALKAITKPSAPVAPPRQASLAPSAIGFAPYDPRLGPDLTGGEDNTILYIAGGIGLAILAALAIGAQRNSHRRT